jgi:hypothetical protein
MAVALVSVRIIDVRVAVVLRKRASGACMPSVQATGPSLTAKKYALMAGALNRLGEDFEVRGGRRTA